MRIEKLGQTFDVDMRLVHFPLHPDTPAEGRAMSEIYGPRGIDADAAHARMKGLMDAEGLPYGKRTHTYNSRLAQELGTWADTVDGGAALHDALYRAYFVDTRNISDTGVLLEIVATAGLDVAAARAAIETRRFKDAVDADWQKARAYGVTGVPTFVAGGYGVVGAQPYAALAQLVTRAGAAAR